MARQSIKRICITILLTLAFGTTAAFWMSSPASAIPRSVRELQQMRDDLHSTGLKHGDIPSLNSPSFITVQETSINMEASAQVFIVPFPDGIRIYPQKYLVWHEVVNEVIQGVPYCITYSPISGSLAVYNARVRGQNLIFDAEGRLYNNNTILIDRNTGSLWSQLLGMAIDGPLRGAGLTILPSYWTTWKFASEAFPDAKVMTTPRGTQRNYNKDPYGSYLVGDNYYDDERILYPLSRFDASMHPKNRILGIEAENSLIAINIEYVRTHKIVNFYCGLVPLVAFYDERLDVARIFTREVWEGRPPALFTLHEGNIRDIQTRSVWTLDGQCVQGNLQGATLNEQYGSYAFWFAWAAFHPETETVPGDTVVPDSALIMGNVGGNTSP